MEKCKICEFESVFVFSKKVLNKYDVKYYRCSNCKFIQTEQEYWLPEAYSSAITNQDIGLLGRNIAYSKLVSGIIKSLFDKKGRFLDYGGGYGTFVRLMRDAGFDFYRFDTYCENIFAKGYDADQGDFELLTSFEVFEHLQDPLNELEKMLSYSSNILFSTELQPGNGELNDWWYIMPETGQHIALYSTESLLFLAKKYNLHLYSNGSTFHLLSKIRHNNKFLRLLFNPYFSKIYNKINRNPSSLLMTDYKKLIS